MRIVAGFVVAGLFVYPQQVLAEPGPARLGAAQVAVASTKTEPTAKRPAEPAPAKVASTGGASTAPQAPVTKAAPQTSSKPRKPSKPLTTLVARIDLAAQRMQVTENGKVVGDWLISSGTRRHATPPGSFRPKWASRMWYSRQYDNAPMPYAVFFNRGIATHGTNATSRLGRPASHGCIRLRTANARKFYRLVHRHGYKRTRIIVSGRPNYASYKKKRVKRRAQRRTTRRNRQARTYRSNRRARRQNVWSQGNEAARYRARVRRYHQTRRYSGRMVYPGDRY